MLRTLLAAATIAATAAVVSGCASPPPVVKPTVDSVTTSLDRVIDSGSVLPSHSASADAPAIPAKMGSERITIKSYVGDASNLLSRMAKARGMEFKINGPEPRLPLLVTVDVDSVSFENFLSQVGFQFGQRADLVLGDRFIEIRYRGQP